MLCPARKSAHGTFAVGCAGTTGVFFCAKKEERDMPKNQFQRIVFAFITVVITVHAYVFYSLYVINGNILMQINGTNSIRCKCLYRGVELISYMPYNKNVVINFLIKGT